MRDVFEQLERWTQRGDRVALATVVDVRRSAPRPPGAKMAVNEHGEIAGAVSGGCVEGAVVEIAERVIDGARPELVHFGISDSEAWDVGLPCGGEIDVWIQGYEQGPFERAARAGDRAAEVTLLEGPRAGAKLVLTPDGDCVGSLGSASADAVAVAAATAALWTGSSKRRGAIFIDVVAQPARLMLVGAVDIAAALCTLARATGWRPFVIDPRARFARSEQFADAEDVLPIWPKEAFARLGGIDPATAVVALTHDPKLDDAALIPALRSPAMFVGAMGSRHAQSRRFERLLDGGLETEELERLSAPVGLDIGARAPEETALSILAELIAVRHRRDGGRLRTVSGPIHEVAV
jgi:xanthine dehydrogenase accessory factor